MGSGPLNGSEHEVGNTKLMEGHDVQQHNRELSMKIPAPKPSFPFLLFRSCCGVFIRAGPSEVSLYNNVRFLSHHPPWFAELLNASKLYEIRCMDVKNNNNNMMEMGAYVDSNFHGR